MGALAYDFSAKDVFEVAVQIEKNGAAFYRKAAELQSDAENKEFLNKLAVMEDGHESTFVEMQKQLTEAEKSSTVFDPNDESSLYLRAMADSHGGEGSPSAANALSGKESMDDDSYIRKAAIKYNVPNITTTAAATAAARGIAARRKGRANLRSLQSYHSDLG